MEKDVFGMVRLIKATIVALNISPYKDFWRTFILASWFLLDGCCAPPHSHSFTHAFTHSHTHTLTHYLLLF